MTLGEKIRKLRLGKDLTQRQLGAQTGLGNNISGYEKGHLRPSVKTLKKLADALEVHPDELLATEAEDQASIAQDEELSRLFREVGKLPEGDVQKAKWFLNVLVKQHRLQQMIAS